MVWRSWQAAAKRRKIRRESVLMRWDMNILSTPYAFNIAGLFTHLEVEASWVFICTQCTLCLSSVGTQRVGLCASPLVNLLPSVMCTCVTVCIHRTVFDECVTDRLKCRRVPLCPNEQAVPLSRLRLSGPPACKPLNWITALDGLLLCRLSLGTKRHLYLLEVADFHAFQWRTTMRCFAKCSKRWTTRPLKASGFLKFIIFFCGVLVCLY